jgi:predicted metal-binding membrane protein
VSTTAKARATDAVAAMAAAAMLLLAVACWVIAVRRMNGMDMGVTTELGSLTFFAGTWVAMMAAMMLPGAVAAALRHAGPSGRVAASSLFAGSYLAVWALFGVAVYALYRPHGASVVGRGDNRRRRLRVHAAEARLPASLPRERSLGFGFGMFCVGSSVGLMLVLVALGPKSVTWMAVVGGVVLAQKLLPPRAAIDVPLALGILGLGVATVL